VNVLVVSGIWPPDAGGPASHAAALARFLHGRGHTVSVVTTAGSAPAAEPFEIHWVRRSLAPGVRHVAAVSAIARRAARSDVVYATSMVRRAALGSTAARTPYVVKLVSDEVFERAARGGRFAGSLEEFQSTGGIRTRLLRRTRDRALRRASVVFSPSAYLERFALAWGVDPEHLVVLPNPAPEIPELPTREAARAEIGLDGPLLAFAGRLGPQKSLAVALAALRRTPGVTLAVAGDGPERGALEGRTRELGLDGRVRFLGTLGREHVLRLFRAADASLLSSAWENFPHTIVESLAVGTPVISTAVGGVPEVIREGENGLLVPPADPEALAAAIGRFFADPRLRERLAANAPVSVSATSEESVFTQIEAVLERAAR
jgi:glycosyltransferase involved in cell wall biosynthesis